MKVFGQKRSLIALAVGMCLAGTVMAQSTTGAITGTAPAGTKITITGTNGITRTITAGSDGRYSSPQLPAGEYSVDALGMKQTVVVTVSGSADASFNALDTVTVVGTKSRVDVSQVDLRTVFTADQLQKLPIGQDINSVALLAPGVIASTSYRSTGMLAGGGGGIASFGGSSASENAYYINGYPVTNPLTSVGFTQLPFNAIGQQQVLTGGYGAEYGRATGGVINIVTKRGTNEWKGGVYTIFEPDAFKSPQKNIYYPYTGHYNATTHYSTATVQQYTDGTLYDYNSANSSSKSVYGFYVGGPVIKDRLFMFVNAEQTALTTGSSRYSGSLGTHTATGASSISAANAVQGWTDSNYKFPRWTAKVDWNITDNHILELTGVQDNDKVKYAYYGINYDTLQRDHNKYRGLDHEQTDTSRLYVAKYTGYFTDDLTLSAMYGQQKVNHIYDVAGFNTASNYVSISPSVVPAAYAAITGVIQPAAALTAPDEDKTKAYRVDLTYKLSQHELRVGYDYFQAKSAKGGSTIVGPGGFGWYYGKQAVPTDPIADSAAAPATNGGLGAQGYYVDQYFNSTGGTASTTEKAWYLEDRWQATKNVLLSLGLRNDSFINYNGSNVAYVKQENNRALRLGAVWDAKGDASLKVFGNMGRYFLAVPNNVAIRAANGSLIADKYYTYTSIDANGVPQGLTPLASIDPGHVCPAGTPAAGAISTNLECGNALNPKTVSANGLKPEYQDEFVAGFETAFNKNFSWGAKVTYRALKSAIDDNCSPVLGGACFIINPGEANDMYQDDGHGNLVLNHFSAAALDLPKVKRLYKALDLFGEYKDPKWYLKVQYTYSKNTGNTEGQLNSSLDSGTGGQTDVSVTADWDIPQIMKGADGLLPNDRTHQIKVFGSYKVSEELRLGGSALIQSGRPNDCKGQYPDGTSPGLYPVGSTTAYYWYCGVPGGQTATGGTPNADYRYSPRGTYGRTPYTATINASIAYIPDWAKHNLTLQLDVLNLFDQQVAAAYFNNSTASRSTANARFGQVLYYTDPRIIRFTARYDF